MAKQKGSSNGKEMNREEYDKVLRGLLAVPPRTNDDISKGDKTEKPAPKKKGKAD